MYAVYGIAHVLFGRDNEGEGKHTCRCHRVVQPEHPGVDVHVGDTQQASKLAKYVQHCDGGSSRQFFTMY